MNLEDIKNSIKTPKEIKQKCIDILSEIEFLTDKIYFYHEGDLFDHNEENENEVIENWHYEYNGYSFEGDKNICIRHKSYVGGGEYDRAYFEISLEKFANLTARQIAEEFKADLFKKRDEIAAKNIEKEEQEKANQAINDENWEKETYERLKAKYGDK